MADIVGPPASSIRNRPITMELRALLDGAADANGIDRVVIVSGGQTGNHAPELNGVVGGWTGSTRHDNGRAADIELVRNGTTLRFTDSDGSEVAAFVTSAAAGGAIGIGAGVNYMGPKRLHVGYGTSPSDTQELVWGAGGKAANAPAWLRAAAAEGWKAPVVAMTAGIIQVRSSPRSFVSARGGLWLRRGPGTGFDRARLLDYGTPLTVLGFDGDWARVDLEGDGRIDGHVYAAFLGTSDAGDADDGVEEPVHESFLAELTGGEATAAGKRSRKGGPRNNED